jgi:hypothetical protein
MLHYCVTHVTLVEGCRHGSLKKAPEIKVNLLLELNSSHSCIEDHDDVPNQANLGTAAAPIDAQIKVSGGMSQICPSRREA